MPFNFRCGYFEVMVYLSGPFQMKSSGKTRARILLFEFIYNESFVPPLLFG